MSWHRITASRGDGEWLVREAATALSVLVADGVSLPHRALDAEGDGAWLLLAWPVAVDDDYPVIGEDVPESFRVTTTFVLGEVDREHHPWVQEQLTISLRRLQRSLAGEGGRLQDDALAREMSAAEAVLVGELHAAWPHQRWSTTADPPAVVGAVDVGHELALLAIPDNVEELLDSAHAVPGTRRTPADTPPASADRAVQAVAEATREARHAIEVAVASRPTPESRREAAQACSALVAASGLAPIPSTRTSMTLLVELMTAALLTVMVWTIAMGTGNPDPGRLIVIVSFALMCLFLLEFRASAGKRMIASTVFMLAVLAGIAIGPISVLSQASSMRTGATTASPAAGAAGTVRVIVHADPNGSTREARGSASRASWRRSSAPGAPSAKPMRAKSRSATSAHSRAPVRAVPPPPPARAVAPPPPASDRESSSQNVVSTIPPATSSPTGGARPEVTGTVSETTNTRSTGGSAAIPTG